jgi:hypothetical protein
VRSKKKLKCLCNQSMVREVDFSKTPEYIQKNEKDAIFLLDFVIVRFLGPPKIRISYLHFLNEGNPPCFLTNPTHFCEVFVCGEIWHKKWQIFVLFYWILTADVT